MVGMDESDSGFSREALARQLTIAEAAALWCGLPFSILSADETVEMDGWVSSMRYPQLDVACDALIEATDAGEIPVALDEDGYPVRVELRVIGRDDLKAWLALHHPTHRPALLFPSAQGKAPTSSAPNPASAAAAPLLDGPMLSAADVRALFDISATTLASWTKSRGFPQPTQAGPGTKKLWSLSAVSRWKAENTPS